MSAYCVRVDAGTTRYPLGGAYVDVKRIRAFSYEFPVVKKYSCDECKHKLVCLMAPNCDNVFERAV